MFRGGFEPLPAPLGGDGGLEGINAAQHARICADLTAAKRVAPIAVIGIASNATIDFYLSAVGCGTDHQSVPTVTKLTTGSYQITWASSYENDLEEDVPWSIESAFVTSEIGSSVRYSYVYTLSTTQLVIRHAAFSTGSLVDRACTVVVYGSWGNERSIGDYGGSITKKDDTKEHTQPYASQIYQDLKQQRGSAYTQKTGTIVHAENLAIARSFASTGFRLPEKMRNNMIGPAKADEGLDYWAAVLGVARRPGESKFEHRDRLTIHRRPGVGATYDNMVSEFGELLGDAFIGVTLNHSGEFETPPATTYWPTINPGPDTYDLGAGAWVSERAQILINVEQPPGMSDGEFGQLMNVDLLELVDRMLPIWCTAQWRDANAIRIVWDGATITWDGTGITWDNLYDWNS